MTLHTANQHPAPYMSHSWEATPRNLAPADQSPVLVDAPLWAGRDMAHLEYNAALNACVDRHPAGKALPTMPPIAHDLHCHWETDGLRLTFHAGGSLQTLIVGHDGQQALRKVLGMPHR